MYFFSTFCLCLFSLAKADVDPDPLTIQYYTDLIVERTAALQNYTPAQNNEEFASGVSSNTTQDSDNYDIIIVGAGAAGALLATRLSEIDEVNILLLEAGGDEEDDFNVIPAFWMYNTFVGNQNWDYYSTPQNTSCLGMKGQKCIIPRGKGLGGSTSINTMMHVIGNHKDYDQWAALGNPGWAFEDVKPYFKKSENSQIKGDKGYHGKGGLWNVEYSEPPEPLFSNMIEVSQELSIPILDYNGRQQIGYSQMQYNQKFGQRQSTRTAFLNYARKRRNLKIVTGALVTKILINNTTAEGVEYVTKDQKFTAKATKEVLISGGAINTPQLLMLSGIGPNDHLREKGIEVIADLPVGMNYVDHAMFVALVFRTNFTTPSVDTVDSIVQYLNGFGPLTKPVGVDGVGFSLPKNDRPRFEYLTATASGDIVPILTAAFNFDDSLVENYLEKINPSTDLFIFLILLHPKSRGRVTLKSNDPLDFPDIDPNMLAEQEDIDDFLEGIDFVFNLTQAPALQEVNATYLDFDVCPEYPTRSREYWVCLLRQMTVLAYHPCGTTPMGRNPSTSVVDYNLRVHGIKNLMVVDTGVFPTTISGHTSAPTVMVAEKSADYIKRKYGYPTSF